MKKEKKIGIKSISDYDKYPASSQEAGYFVSAYATIFDKT
jgi:hypothetical protein